MDCDFSHRFIGFYKYNLFITKIFFSYKNSFIISFAQLK